MPNPTDPHVGIDMPDSRTGFLPHTGFSRRVDTLIYRLGAVFSVVWILLAVSIIANVILRFGFNAGKIYIEELQWHFYAIGISFAMAFAFVSDSHIRVDVLSSRFRKRTTSWIEVAGTVIFLIPYCAFVIWFSVGFVYSSFLNGEVSSSPGGLPYRWIIKSFMPIAFVLIAVAAISRLVRCIAFLRDARH